MKFVTWGLVILFLALGAATVAHPAQSPAQDQGDSLAAAARRAREQKKAQGAPTKVWTNDDLPKNAGDISVIGQPASAETASDGANSGDDAKGAASASGEAQKPGAPTDQKKKEEEAADLAAAKDQLQNLQADLDILQRKYVLDKQTYYSKPEYSSDTQGAADLNGEQDQIDAKQAEIAEAQKKIEELQKSSAPADTGNSVQPSDTGNYAQPADAPAPAQPAPPAQ